MELVDRESPFGVTALRSATLATPTPANALLDPAPASVTHCSARARAIGKRTIVIDMPPPLRIDLSKTGRTLPLAARGWGVGKIALILGGSFRRLLASVSA